MFTYNLTSRTVIVPIVTCDSEIWILKQADIDILYEFQINAFQHIQHFPDRSTNETFYFELGWMHLEKIAYSKKLIFIMTVLVRDDLCIYKQVSILRALKI